MERLSESDTLDSIMLKDLVKLSWSTPESRRIILQNFNGCAPHELSVKQGQKVNYIYRESDWAYVVADDKKAGYVPFTFLAKLGVQSKAAKPRVIDTGTYTKKPSEWFDRTFLKESEEYKSYQADDSNISGAFSTGNNSSDTSQTIQGHGSESVENKMPHEKLPTLFEMNIGKHNIIHKSPLSMVEDSHVLDKNNDNDPPSPAVLYKALHKFTRQEPDDISLRADDIVHLLDDTDPNWFLVRRLDGAQGYVPSNYITEVVNAHIANGNRYKEIVDNNIKAKELQKNSGDTDVFIKTELLTDRSEKSKTDIPVNWKLTSDLKGKIPTIVLQVTEATNQQKTRPKKPPRKKKSQNDLSSLNDSVDSIDTFATDSSMDYLDYQSSDNYLEAENSELNVLNLKQKSASVSGHEDHSRRSNARQNEHKQENRSNRLQGRQKTDPETFKTSMEYDRADKARSPKFKLLSEVLRNDEQSGKPHDKHVLKSSYISESLDTMEPGSEVSFDNWSPRSMGFSESSIMDSSFDDVFGHPLVISESFEEELSPRSNYDKDSVRKSRYPAYSSGLSDRNRERQHGVKSESFSRDYQTSGNESFETESSNRSRRQRTTSKRPLSMPAFKSYQEYQDYFDEYFYEDNDKEFAKRSKENVINVGEILKLRNAREQELIKKNGVKEKLDLQQHLKQKFSNQHKEINSDQDHETKQHNTQSKPKIKEFLLEIPNEKPHLQEYVSEKKHHRSSAKENHRHSHEMTSKSNKGDIDQTGQSNTHVRSGQKSTNNSSDPKEKKTKESSSNVKEEEIKNRFSDLKEKKPNKSKSSRRDTNSNDMQTTGKLAMRQYNSVSDLRYLSENYLSELKGEVDYPDQTKHEGRNSNNSHLRQYNSSTDLREIQGKTDWSFGYPRKVRQNIGRVDDNLCIEHSCTRCDKCSKDKDQFGKGSAVNRSERDVVRTDNDVKKVQNISSFSYSSKYSREDSDSTIELNVEHEDDMTALLKQTANLINKTDKLLEHSGNPNCTSTKMIKQEKEYLKNSSSAPVYSSGQKRPNEHSKKSERQIEQSKKGERQHKQSNKTERQNEQSKKSERQIEQLKKSESLTNESIGDEKCSQFLNNSTIGIHGMTYRIEKMDTTSNTKIKSDPMNEKNKLLKVSGSELSANEKRSVLTDDLNNMVSTRLKDLDLKDIRGITEFVSQFDYKPDIENGLPMKLGEILHIGLDGQDHDEMYWAFSPRLRKYGFVPKKYVKIPMVTII